MNRTLLYCSSLPESSDLSSTLWDRGLAWSVLAQEKLESWAEDSLKISDTVLPLISQVDLALPLCLLCPPLGMDGGVSHS